MRIAIFSESYEPVANGVSTSVRTLVDELRARRHRVYVVAPQYPDYEDGSPFVLRVPSILTPLNVDYPVPYPWFPRLRREFSKTESDVLHTHSPWFLGLLGARLAQQDGLPLVSTYHTLYNHYGHYLFFLPKPAIESMLEWWMPEYYNRCMSVIVPSRAAEDSLRRYGVTSRIVVVPTGVPRPDPTVLTAGSRRAVRELYGIPQDAPLILTVGRLAQEKNLELVLNAFGWVGEQFPDARLLVAGTGPHLEALEAFRDRLPNGRNVLFAGGIARGDLDAVYAAADVFVFGSSTETQGLVIAEARAAGTPCVVVDEGGAPENVVDGEDGLVVPSEVEPFADAICALLRDPDRRGRLRDGCLYNARLYTPDAMTERVQGVYEWAIWQNDAKKLQTAAR
jgi:glycosyltransferase involved in cell wall biosynthesis